jgi:hypothetical protein
MYSFHDLSLNTPNDDGQKITLVEQSFMDSKSANRNVASRSAHDGKLLRELACPLLKPPDACRQKKGELLLKTSTTHDCEIIP